MTHRLARRSAGSIEMSPISEVSRVSTDMEWTPSRGRACSVCATVVPMVGEVCGRCPLCWASQNGADPDHTVGQAIAVEALWLLDSAPQRVGECVQRLRSLAEHAPRPGVTAVLSAAARDLELLAAQ